MNIHIKLKNFFKKIWFARVWSPVFDGASLLELASTKNHLYMDLAYDRKYFCLPCWFYGPSMHFRALLRLIEISRILRVLMCWRDAIESMIFIFISILSIIKLGCLIFFSSIFLQFWHGLDILNWGWGICIDWYWPSCVDCECLGLRIMRTNKLGKQRYGIFWFIDPINTNNTN